MTGQFGARPRVRATDSKERLFAASMALLGRRGVNAVSVDEIARAAGVSKGTVYYNFGSKEKMIGALLEFGARKLLDQLGRDAAVEDPMAALEAMVRSAFGFVQEYPSYAQLWVSEQQRGESPWGDQVQEFRHRITDLITEALRRAVQVPEPLLAASARAMFGAALLTARERSGGEAPPDLDTNTLAVMATVHGLRAMSRDVR